MAQLNGGSMLSDDFILYDQEANLYSSYVPHSQSFQQAVSNDSMYETHSHISEVDYTAMLVGEDSLGELHTSSKVFSLNDPSAVHSYQSQGYAPTTPSVQEAFDLQPYPNIPRTVGDFYSSSSDDEEHLSVSEPPPHFIIHPPTISSTYPFNLAQIGEYHSTPGASPSTSAGYEGFGSSATHSSIHSALGSSRSVNSSIQGSPYSAPEDNWSAGVTAVETVEIEAESWDGNGFINPLDISPADAIESVFEDSPAQSPFYLPPTPRSHSNSPSPLPSRRRSLGRLSPYPTNKPQPSFPYLPPSHRDSLKSSYSKKSTKSTRFSTPDETSIEEMQSPSSPEQSVRDTICPECHKSFRDMKAHLLTHKEERPEKCPIPNCDYAKKGFARKYDCQRHTLTHYKGTMVCCFCPSAGSPAEKSFNRADVFKRHLMSVHHVEQTPPNNKKKTTATSTSKAQKSSKATTPELDGTGKCSTCSSHFSNPQKFYEHLDECVLNKVVEVEPAAAYNELNLGPLRDIKKEDPVLAEILANTSPAGRRLRAVANGEIDEDDDDDDDLPDADDEDERIIGGKRKQKAGKLSNRMSLAAAAAAAVDAAASSSTKIKRGVRFRVSKATIKDGKPRTRRGGKKRKNFPAAWGCSSDSMVTKRRCLMVYDGPNILWRDDMMMHDELQVRARIGADTLVSDLDVWTHKRAQDVFRAANAVEAS